VKSDMRAVIVDRSYGSLILRLIVPLSSLPFKPNPQYNSSLPNGAIEKAGLKPIWLSTAGKISVSESLHVQGLDPDEYITPATVHGRWKCKKHQGVIYQINSKELDLTFVANPSKPIPSREEIDKLYSSLLNLLKEMKGWEAERVLEHFKIFWRDLVAEGLKTDQKRA